MEPGRWQRHPRAIANKSAGKSDMANRVEPGKRNFGHYSLQQQDSTEQVARAPQLGSPGRRQAGEQALLSSPHGSEKGAFDASMQPEPALEEGNRVAGLTDDGDGLPDSASIAGSFTKGQEISIDHRLSGQSASSHLSSRVTAISVTSRMSASPDVLAELPVELLIDILARLQWRDHRKLKALSTGLRATVSDLDSQLSQTREDGRLTPRQFAKMKRSQQAFGTLAQSINPEWIEKRGDDVFAISKRQLNVALHKKSWARSIAENQSHLYWEIPKLFDVDLAIGIGEARGWKSLAVKISKDAKSTVLPYLLMALANSTNWISCDRPKDKPGQLFPERMIALEISGDTSKGLKYVSQDLVNGLCINQLSFIDSPPSRIALERLVYQNPSLNHLSIRLDLGEFAPLMRGLASHWLPPSPLKSLKLLELPKMAEWDLLHSLVQESQLMYLCLQSTGALQGLSLAKLFPASMRELALSGIELSPENMAGLKEVLEQCPGMVLRFHCCDFTEVEPQLLAIIAQSPLAGLSIDNCTKSDSTPYIEAIEGNSSLRTVELYWFPLVTPNIEAGATFERMNALTRNRPDLLVADYGPGGNSKRWNIDAMTFFDHYMPGLN